MEQDLYNVDHNPWLESLKKDPIAVLMDAAPLPIRYQVLRDVLGDQGSDDLEALQQNLRKHQPRRKKMAEQDSQGFWPLDGGVKGLDYQQLKTLQFIKQLESLHELLNLLVTHKQEKVTLGMRELIRYLAESDAPLRLHYLTQAIYLAISFELDSNPVIKKKIWDILKLQNTDGGWSSQPEDSSSCIWTTLFFLWTMGHSEQFKNNRSLRKGLLYVKEHLLSLDQSTLLPGIQVWDTLITGTSGLSLLTGGTLRYLETILMFEDDQRDRKAEKLVDWLISMQLKNGLWPSIVSRDRQGDFAVTLRALKVIKHFQTKRIEETQNYESD